MPALPRGMAYQVWLIQGEQRQSAGVFQVDREGNGILFVELDRPLAEFDAVGVTVEPASGSSSPTSPRVIGVTL
jgi:anti-sigma-K factor RskA